MHQHAPQPLFHAECLEQDLAIGGLDVQVRRHEVGEPTGVGHAFEHLLHDVLGEARFLAQLRCALAGFAVQPHERGVFRVEGRQLCRLADIRFEVAAGVVVVRGSRPHVAVQRQLYAAEAALHLADTCDRAELM